MKESSTHPELLPHPQASATSKAPGLHLTRGGVQASQVHGRKGADLSALTLCGSPSLLLFENMLRSWPLLLAFWFWSQFWILPDKAWSLRTIPSTAAYLSYQRSLCQKLQENGWERRVRQRKEKELKWKQQKKGVGVGGSQGRKNEKARGKMRKKGRREKKKDSKRKRVRKRKFNRFMEWVCQSSLPVNCNIAFSFMSTWIIHLNPI